MRQLLFDGGDAARILAADHVGDLLRQVQSLFLNDLVVTDHVYGDVVINVTTPGGGDSTNVDTLEFEAVFYGKPTYTPAAA